MAAVDPASLAQRYKLQLQQTGETLKDSGNNFKQLAESTINEYKASLMAQREQLQPQVDSLLASIKDLESPVPANAPPFLLRTYLWTAVCLFIGAVARTVSGMFLHHIIGAIFDPWVAATLTFGILPAYVFLQLRKVEMPETQREQVVLFGSVAEGVMIGALFSNRFATIYGPPIFLLPLGMGLLAHFAGSKEQVNGNRRVFLGALVGGAAVGYVVYGFVLNFSFGYILSVAILSAAAVVDLQLKLASIQRGDTSPQLEQWKTVVVLTIASAIGHFLNSTTDKESAEAANKPAEKSE